MLLIISQIVLAAIKLGLQYPVIRNVHYTTIKFKDVEALETFYSHIATLLSSTLPRFIGILVQFLHISLHAIVSLSRSISQYAEIPCQLKVGKL